VKVIESLSQVYGCQKVDGKKIEPFDGGQLGILNFNNRILITHELLHDFLHNSTNQRATHKGWIRGKFMTWLRVHRGSKGATQIVLCVCRVCDMCLVPACATVCVYCMVCGVSCIHLVSMYSILFDCARACKRKERERKKIRMCLCMYSRGEGGL